MKYDFESINLIAEAIREPATASLYDYWILGVALATFIASIAVAVFSYRLNKQQKDIAKKQSEISEKQTHIMEQQNKIALFKERSELISILQKLRWFGAKYKIVLENASQGNSKKLFNKKYDIWRDTLAAILVFTEAPSLNREIDEKFHKKYYSHEVERIPILSFFDTLDKFNDLKIAEERRNKEYKQYLRLLHLESVKAIEKINQVHLLFNLSKENTNHIVDITEALDLLYKEVNDSNISVDGFLEKILNLCELLEKIDCFNEMNEQTSIIERA